MIADPSAFVAQLPRYELMMEGTVVPNTHGRFVMVKDVIAALAKAIQHEDLTPEEQTILKEWMNADQPATSDSGTSDS